MSATMPPHVIQCNELGMFTSIYFLDRTLLAACGFRLTAVAIGKAFFSVLQHHGLNKQDHSVDLTSEIGTSEDLSGSSSLFRYLFGPLRTPDSVHDFSVWLVVHT